MPQREPWPAGGIDFRHAHHGRFAQDKIEYHVVGALLQAQQPPRKPRPVLLQEPEFVDCRAITDIACMPVKPGDAVRQFGDGAVGRADEPLQLCGRRPAISDGNALRQDITPGMDYGDETVELRCGHAHRQRDFRTRAARRLVQLRSEQHPAQPVHLRGQRRELGPGVVDTKGNAGVTFNRTRPVQRHNQDIGGTRFGRRRGRHL